MYDSKSSSNKTSEFVCAGEIEEINRTKKELRPNRENLFNIASPKFFIELFI
jgi:hypothetical protein